jgi:hypothetical protein
MKKTKIETKFIELAELLLELCEDHCYNCDIRNPDIPMPIDIIEELALLLQHDYRKGLITEDENGCLYDIDMDDDYWGLFDNFYESIKAQRKAKLIQIDKMKNDSTSED